MAAVTVKRRRLPACYSARMAVSCSNCGATAKEGDGRFCSHCGSNLPDVPRFSAEEWTTHPNRFDEARASEWFGRAQLLPAPSPSLFAAIVPLLFLALWLAVGWFIFNVTASMSAGTLEIVGVSSFIGLGAVFVLVVFAKGIRYYRAPAIGRLVVVLGQRTEVSKSSDDSSVTTTYYTTVVDREGEREELETTGNTYGYAVAGCIGLAQVRMHRLVAFHTE